jgi:hypothetical protein
MSINDVIYRLAHAYPGGIKALAGRMGKNPAVLQNKVNPNCDTHHPYAEEAAQIADLADSDDVAKYFAERRSGLFVRMNQKTEASDTELIDLILSMQKEMGDWATAIQKALSDGVIDPKELEIITKEFNEFCSAVLELMNRLKSIVRERRTVARK